MRVTFPFEITKFFDTKVNIETGKREIIFKNNYAFAIEENFKAIKKYFNELINTENIIPAGLNANIVIEPGSFNANILIESASIGSLLFEEGLLDRYSPTFQFTVPGILKVGYNQPPATPVPCEVIAIQLYAYVKVAPSSSSLIVEVNDNDVSIGTVTIATGNYGSSTTISKLLSLNDVITVDINQADGVVADLTVQVRT